MKIAVLPGDGIGPEIVREARKVLDALRRGGLPIETEEALIGGAGYDAAGHPLPQKTLEVAQAADAVLLGAVGGPRYDTLARELRPEQGAAHGIGLRVLDRHGFSQQVGHPVELPRDLGRSGGALEKLSIFALGIMPYVSSSIIL